MPHKPLAEGKFFGPGNTHLFTDCSLEGLQFVVGKNQEERFQQHDGLPQAGI